MRTTATRKEGVITLTTILETEEEQRALATFFAGVSAKNVRDLKDSAHRIPPYRFLSSDSDLMYRLTFDLFDELDEAISGTRDE